MLRDTVSLQIIVIYFLIILAVDLDETAVTLSHGIRIIMIDIDRSGKRTAGNSQHDGKSRRCRHIQHFVHERQARG